MKPADYKICLCHTYTEGMIFHPCKAGGKVLFQRPTFTHRHFVLFILYFFLVVYFIFATNVSLTDDADGNAATRLN